MNSANPRVVHIFSRDEWLYDTPAERARFAAVIADERRDVRAMRLRQAAEIVVMLAVAVFIGFALAVQL